MTGMGGFLAWLGGGDRDILAEVPQERSRFVQMALVLLTTSSIAMVSMMFAMYNGVGVPLAAAVLVGIFWGVVILNLDRYLVLSMGHVRTWRRMLLMASPRFLLAMVISLVIATPLTLRIFQHDIDVQIARTQATESRQMQSLEAQSLPAQQARSAQSAITRDQSILAGHLPVGVSSPQLQDDQSAVNQLTPKVASAKTAEISAYEAWQCELYGDGAHCANASSKAGNGPIAQAKQSLYKQALSTYNSLDSQLQTAQGKLAADEKSLGQAQGSQLAKYQAQARRDLPVQEKSLATDNAEVQKEQNNAQGTVNNDNGILAQLSALSAASAANPVLQLAQIIVTALFFLIEILPVMVKLLLNLAPPTAYDKVAGARAKIITDRTELERIAARRDAERASDERRKLEDVRSRARINVAADMGQREEDLGVHANEHVAAEMKTILDAQLSEWTERVRQHLGLPADATGFRSGSGPAGGHAAGGHAGSGYAGSGYAAANGNGHSDGALSQGDPLSQGGALSLNGASPRPGGFPSSQPWTPPASGFGLPEDEGLL